MLRHKPLMLILLLTFLLLQSCSRDRFQDLHDYIAQIRKTVMTNNKNTVVPLKFPTALTYQASKLRSPFEEIATASFSKSGHPLNAFPLSMLRLVGVMTEGEKTWGVILAPDNNIYQVTIGDVIGDHYGKITKIYPNRIEAMEQVSDDKTITQRIVTLQLKDEGQ